MPGFVEVLSSTQHRLPAPCPGCLWWQTAKQDATGQASRLEWMRRVEREWGPPGLMLEDDGETLAAVQYAPVGKLPRTRILPLNPPPDDDVLLFCLRGRLGCRAHDPVRLLHRSMFELRRRGVRRIFAYCRPLEDENLCGLRNLCGLEFLQRQGFTVVSGNGQVFLVKAELVGLIPALKELRSLLPERRPWTAPSPAMWSSTRK